MFLNKANFKTHSAFCNAIDDICSECCKVDCARYKQIITYKVFRLSHNFFGFDCFKKYKEKKRTVKNGSQSEELGFYCLSE